MRKSIPGFILGLLGSIGGAIVSFYAWVILNLVFGFIGEALMFFRTALLLNIISNLVAFIASFFYFKKAKMGGILMFIATILNAYLFVILFTTENVSKSLSLIIVTLLPSCLMLISALLGLFSKKRL